ncbi:MAG: electron transfer flavoprotein subunit alpha [Gammaproteobacteria bacterium]|nr:electron transfer flavoprotein subunit alpha [Gammaproteobacteria bacterium]
MSSLVIAEHENNELKPSTLVAIAAALEIAVDVDLLIAGSQVGDVANSAKEISGLNKIIVADDPAYEYQLAENIAKLVVDVSEAYTHLLTPHSTVGRNFLPRVAALLGVAQISDIQAVESEDTFQRPIYAGNAIATVKSSDAIKVISVRGTAFDPVSITGGSADIENIDISHSLGISAFISQDLAVSERPELTAANIIISGGRGMQDGENFTLLEGIADKLGAAIGASRAAVDAGFVPNDMQVGQTGKIVAPDLYIAVGISGAIQHLAGMKDSKVIVAINKDEDAPIFQVADYGLVADLFKALPELEAEL